MPLLGYKDFSDGNPLFGDEIDGYLMQQSIMNFASESARDTALVAVAVEGMFAYTRDNGMLWRRTAGEWREALPWLVRKTADEGVVSNAVPQNDNELLFPAKANGRYVIDVTLFVQAASSAADLSVAWSLPSGSINFGGAGPDRAVAAGAAGNYPGAGEWLGLIGAVGAAIGFGISAVAGGNYIRLSGLFTCGATPGNVNLQWSQLVSTPNTTTMKSGSFLRAERIA
jgi:hypothetical protein